MNEAAAQSATSLDRNRAIDEIYFALGAADIYADSLDAFDHSLRKLSDASLSHLVQRVSGYDRSALEFIHNILWYFEWENRTEAQNARALLALIEVAPVAQKFTDHLDYGYGGVRDNTTKIVGNFARRVWEETDIIEHVRGYLLQTLCEGASDYATNCQKWLTANSEALIPYIDLLWERKSVDPSLCESLMNGANVLAEGAL